MGLEAAGELERGLRLAADAQVEGLQPAQQEPRRVGRGDDPARRCGRSRRRSRSASSRQVTAPSRASEWPARYFVALCRTRSAPCSSGRSSTGVEAVASTSRRAPAACAAAACVDVGNVRKGLAGASSQTSCGAVRRGPRLVELDRLQAPAPEHPERDPGAVVGALRQRDGVAGLQEREHDGGRRPGARGERGVRAPPSSSPRARARPRCRPGGRGAGRRTGPARRPRMANTVARSRPVASARRVSRASRGPLY